jgi:predicted DNA-binding protein
MNVLRRYLWQVSMRITLDIPDEIHARLKARAKEEGTTMRAIVLRGIERVLRTEDAPPAKESTARFPAVHSNTPGTLKLGEEGVYEYIDFP